MRQVAKAAGVSAMAVSLALRGSRKISSDTRLRVIQASEELGYKYDYDISVLMSLIRASKRATYSDRKAVAIKALNLVQLVDGPAAAERLIANWLETR